jgi:hypothetical protein
MFHRYHYCSSIIFNYKINYTSSHFIVDVVLLGCDGVRDSSRLMPTIVRNVGIQNPDQQ